MPAGWAGSEEADCFVKFLVLQDEEGSLPPPASLQLVLFSGYFNPLHPLLQFTLRLPSFPGAGSGVWALSTALASTPTGCGAQHLCVCMRVCVHFCSFFLLVFFSLILCLGWLFYLSKNLERPWDLFFGMTFSTALALSLCACCGFAVIDFICCCSWHQS